MPPEPRDSGANISGPGVGAGHGRGACARALGLGFNAVGVCRLTPSERFAAFEAWVAEGCHGEMEYLARHQETRRAPARVLVDERSVDAQRASEHTAGGSDAPGEAWALMVLSVYTSRDDVRDRPLPPGHGRVARYARGRDYHRVFKKRLLALCDALRATHPRHAFRAFVDTAPVLERELAERAGLGVQGKNTMLLHPRLGSFTLLGGVATTLDLSAHAASGTDSLRERLSSAASAARPAADPCAGCTRCIDACPTAAITPRRVDARRCISYLTIEHRSSIPPALMEGIGGWVYGCDICQEVCPYNAPRDVAFAQRSGGVADLGLQPGPNPGSRAAHPRADVLDLLAIVQDRTPTKAERFRGSAMKRATDDMFRRNAAIALAANPVPGAEAVLAAVAADAAEPEMVRQAARWAWKRLQEADGRDRSGD